MQKVSAVLPRFLLDYPEDDVIAIGSGGEAPSSSLNSNRWGLSGI